MKIRTLMQKISVRAGAAFLFTFCLCLVLVFLMTSNRIQAERLAMEQLILERGIRINDTMTGLLFKTQTLASFVVLNDGELADFPHLAAILVDDPAILNILIAPDGVVSDVYPRAGNEALIGLDFFQQETALDETYVPSETRFLAAVARDTRQLVFGGPFTAIQGGEILVSRMPIFLEDDDGEEIFWGISGVTLRFPDTLSGAGLSELIIMGYDYEIWRINPDTDERHVVLCSGENVDGRAGMDYIEIPLTILNTTWHFRIYAPLAWYVFPETWLSLFISLFVSLLVGIVIQNHHNLKNLKNKLEELSNTDPLTEINNRRYFLQSATKQLDRVIRQNNEAFIIILDVDHFKKINDNYGHSNGDIVLREIAFRISNTLRPYDLFARYGGEEFIMFVTEIDKESVAQLAERIRESISKMKVKLKNTSISVTASLGAASLAPTNVLEDAIDLADKALYKAKEDGRNRVEFA